MPRFILIEQSLDRVGGHYHGYATEILKAAESAGYDPILATNARLDDLSHFSNHWQVLPVFPFGSTSIHRIPRTYAKANSPRGGSLCSKMFRLIDGLADQIKTSISRWRWLRHRSRIQGFRDACLRLFDQIGFQQDDVVFCSTTSDADLMALSQFLVQRPESKKADWHLQFHFSSFNGREPDYDRQMKNVVGLQRRFNQAVDRVAGHRLYFYTTTSHLAEQYNRLDVRPFDTLPWPVSPRFEQDNNLPRDRPLRLVCGGAVRREKGADHLCGLIERLKPSLLDTEEVQLLFQTNQKLRSKAMLGLNVGAVTHSPSARPEVLPLAPIVSVPHPLSPDDYTAYIQGADIGLLFYDADEYYVRCSGILVEFLSAGVPVIAPAGCWLGDQLTPANNEYLDDLAKTVPVHQQWSKVDLSWDDHESSGQLSIPTQRSGNDLLIRLDWLRPNSLGTYVRIVIEQLNCREELVDSTSWIVNRRTRHDAPDNLAPPLGLVHLHDDVLTIQASLENAYHDEPVAMNEICLQLLSPAKTPSGHWPLGKIGLAAASYEQIPRLIQDMVDHYGHYQIAADSFAQSWNLRHAPIETIRRIEERSNRNKVLRQAG